MLNLYIMCGLAFSGKSTLARKIAENTGSRLIAFDKLWVEKEKGQPVSKDDAGWRFIRKVAQDEIAKVLREGTSVVYDDNNVRFEHRKEIRVIARRFGANAVVIYLNTPMELIRQRELNNKSTGERHEVEPKNFQKVVEQMEIPIFEEHVLEFTPDINLEEFLKKVPR